MSPIELFSVKDKVVHVSGGSRGIGKAIAEALSAAGARVVVSARSESALKATGLDYQVCDISDAARIERCVENIVVEFGRLDVLFNVAGINFRHAAETFPEDKLDQILGVNVRGNFLMARACGRAMAARKQGKVINIASLHTHVSLAGVSAYGTSKGAIGSMTRALAVEWAAYNIQVNAIAPGFIRTDLNKALWEDPRILHWAEDRTPARRLGVPGDLVGTAIFLSSAASDFMTGQVLYVDGGLTAGSTWPLVTPR
ncbi:MAG: SDR family oxidoreductase [Bryobacterales bacterium]|nr:SDR family oxidoreductase [Bryobacterales bacterium]